MIVLKTYNRQELDALLKSKTFLDFPFLPISRHRAHSHMKNHRAREEDILFILALEGEKLAGYIGILPDDLFHHNRKYHVGWLSTLFVHPDFRGKKIAQKLLKKAYDEYNHHILITEFTPEAENMYFESGNFEYINPLLGCTFYYRFNLKEILPAKNKKYRRLQPFLKYMDICGNSFMKLGYAVLSSNSKNFKVAEKLDDEVVDFIRKNENGNSFNRNAEELKWILNFPWILKESESNEERIYQFSAYEPKFKYLILKVYQRNLLKNIMLLSVRNGTLKLHYLFGDENPELCAEILFQYILKNDIFRFICFRNGINKSLGKRFNLYKKERVRRFFIHKDLKRELDHQGFVFNVEAGDGDCIFF